MYKMRYVIAFAVMLGWMAVSAGAVGWTENFDGVNPLSNWVTNAGTPTLTSPPTNPRGLSFVDADGATTRISRVFNNTGIDYIKLSFAFYNNSAASFTQRAVGAFHNGTAGAPGTNQGLMRLGTNNLGTYQFLYYVSGTVSTVDTGVAVFAGMWHTASIEARLSTKTIKWTIDGVSGTVYNANMTAQYFPNMVTLGNQYSNGASGAPDTSTWFDDVVVSDVQPNTLALNVQGLDVPTNTLYVPYGGVVTLSMDVANLAQKVNGCQAMLGYANYYLFAQSGCVAPGGGFWDQLIYNSWDVSAGVLGAIDTAIGVNAQGAVGTQASGPVASIQLIARDKDGVTQVVFRPDLSPDPFLIGSTILSDMSALPVFPTKYDSQNIVVDGVPPALSIVSAMQNGQELLTSLGSTISAVQGRVDILVDAGDLNVLPAAPAVNVYDATSPIPVQIPAVFDGQVPYGSGHYYYHFTVPPTATNGLAQIRSSVFDKAGNRTDDLDHFNIDKNQITGQVELEGFVGASRRVTFVATNGNTFLKAWDLTLTGWALNKTSYTLTYVPGGTTGISAKTAWNLRSKLAVTLVGGQAVANFTGTDKLRGGDLTGDNSINLLDYSTMKTNWSIYPATALPDNVANINGDTVVGTLDYNIMKRNWFQTGQAQ